MELLTHSGIRQEQGLCHRLRAEGHGAEGIVRRQVRYQAFRPYAPHPFLQRGRFGVSDMGEDAEKREHISIILDEYGCLRGVVSMEDVIETMTGVEIVDEDDVAVDMQAFAKEKSRKMSQR